MAALTAVKVRAITNKNSEGGELSITEGKEYEVLEISGDSLRVLTDPDSWPYGNDPVLIEAKYFEVTDPEEPDFWVTEYEEGERYSQPFEWNNCLMERYHDREREAHKIFWECVRKNYPWTWHQRCGS